MHALHAAVGFRKASTYACESAGAKSRGWLVASLGVLLLAALCPSRAASSTLRDAPVKIYEAKNFSITLPSSLSERPFARLEARAIVRRKKALFGTRLALASPGYGAVGLKLRLFPVACSAADWDGLLAALAGLAKDRSAVTGGLLLILPDGRAFVSPRTPEIEDGEIRFAHDMRRTGRAPDRLVVFRHPDGRIETTE